MGAHGVSADDFGSIRPTVHEDACRWSANDVVVKVELVKKRAVLRLDRSYGAETGRIPNCAGGS